jgi:hypothetical protein
MVEGEGKRGVLMMRGALIALGSTEAGWDARLVSGSCDC